MKKLCLLISVCLLVSCSLPYWVIKSKQRSHVKLEEFDTPIGSFGPQNFPVAVDIEIPATPNPYNIAKIDALTKPYQRMGRGLKQRYYLRDKRIPLYISTMYVRVKTVKIQTGTAGDTLWGMGL